MELHQLRYFVAVAEELSYRSAAERLRISKPTLSRQVQVLERSLGHKLIERDRRRIVLTPAGQTLLEHAREVLASCDRLRRAVATATYAHAPLALRVVNGVQHVLEKRLLAVEQDAALQVNMTVTSGMDAEDAVVSGRADAAVLWLPSGYHSTLHAERLSAHDVYLAVPEGHRLAALDTVPVDALGDEPIALFPREIAPAIFDAFAGHLMPDGVRAERILEAPTGLIPMMGMLRTVQEGRAVSPFVHMVGVSLAVPGVVLKPLSPRLQLPITLVCREPTRPDLRRLITLLTSPS